MVQVIPEGAGPVKGLLTQIQHTATFRSVVPSAANCVRCELATVRELTLLKAGI
jgi:hypothetical protein